MRQNMAFIMSSRHNPAQYDLQDLGLALQRFPLRRQRDPSIQMEIHTRKNFTHIDVCSSGTAMERNR